MEEIISSYPEKTDNLQFIWNFMGFIWPYTNEFMVVLRFPQSGSRKVPFWDTGWSSKTCWLACVKTV